MADPLSSISINVRMGMPVAEAELLADLLLRLPEDVRGSVLDQLWLRTALIEQRRRMRVNERAEFDVRADRVLAHLDPMEA